MVIESSPESPATAAHAPPTLFELLSPAAQQDVADAQRVVSALGIKLDAIQPYVAGEGRLLARGKQVLLGVRLTDSRRVVVKVSRSAGGIEEIQRERAVRRFLDDIQTRGCAIKFPLELAANRVDGYEVSVTEFLAQSTKFEALSFELQKSLSLQALTLQEHAYRLSDTLPVPAEMRVHGSQTYQELFQRFRSVSIGNDAFDAEFCSELSRVESELARESHLIDSMSGTLTHCDFVPHNFRVVDGEVFFLDLGSFVIGCKYESWGRFLNYMCAYNPTLEYALLEHVKLRGASEYNALRAMRIYQLAFLLMFYADLLARVPAALVQITRLRLTFWQRVFVWTAANQRVPTEIVEQFVSQQELLRDPAERVRQRAL